MKIEFTKQNLSIFHQHHIQAIYLFGSRAVEKNGPLSDYDYAILTSNKGHSRGDKLYDLLYDILSEISPRTIKNDVIDVIFLRDVGLELRFHVVRYGKVLFESDTRARLEFESRTELLYCDYRPILNFFDNAILDAL